MKVLRQKLSTITYIKAFLSPPIFLDDDDKNRIAHTLHFLILAILGLMIAVIPFIIFVSEQKIGSAIILSVAFIICYLMLNMLSHGKVYQAASLFIVYLWINSAIFTFFAGGSFAAAAGLFIPVISMSALFLGQKKSLIATAITLIYLLGLVVISESSNPITPYFPLRGIAVWIMFVFSTVLVLIPLLRLHSELLKALKNIKAQLAERQNIEKALRESEERFRLISSVTSDYTFTNRFDENGNLKYLLLTGAFEKITGYTPEEFQAIGGWQATLHPDDLEQDASDIAQLSKNKPIETQLRIIRKDGQVRWMRVNAHPIWDYENNRMIGVNGAVRDVTDSEEAESAILDLNAQLKNKATHLTIINEIASDISAITDLTSTLKRIQAKLQSILPMDAFYVALYNRESSTVEFPIMYDSGKFWKQPVDLITPHGNIDKVITTGQPILINRTAAEITAHDTKRRLLGDVKQVSASIVVTPLKLGDKIIGVISVQSYILNSYNEKHIELLMGAGYQIAIAIENARLYDSLQNELAERKRLEDELQTHANQLEILVEKRTNALSHAKEQLELIINTTTDALAFAHPNGDLLMTNAAFHEMFNNQPMTSIESILLSLADENQLKSISDALLNVMHDNKKQNMEMKILAKDNRLTDIDLTLIPMAIDDDEERNGILLSGHDITQYKEVERFKARFIADAVHDLATPISGLNSRVYLLKRSPEKLEEHVRALENQVQHLRHLLEDLRTLSQMDRGQIILSIEKCNLNDLVQRVFDTYEPVALDKKQLLILQADPSLPEVPLDQRQFRRVLVNLVSNAINYTPEHKQIHIKTGIKNQSIVIEVSDEGMGISPKDLPFIFDRFYRADEARANVTGGTGLGLAITQEIVNLHGGSITVSSKLNHGTTFTTLLPIQTT